MPIVYEHVDRLGVGVAHETAAVFEVAKVRADHELAARVSERALYRSRIKQREV